MEMLLQQEIQQVAGARARDNWVADLLGEPRGMGDAVPPSGGGGGYSWTLAYSGPYQSVGMAGMTPEERLDYINAIRNASSHP